MAPLASRCVCNRSSSITKGNDRSLDAVDGPTECTSTPALCAQTHVGAFHATPRPRRADCTYVLQASRTRQVWQPAQPQHPQPGAPRLLGSPCIPISSKAVDRQCISSARLRTNTCNICAACCAKPPHAGDDHWTRTHSKRLWCLTSRFTRHGNE